MKYKYNENKQFILLIKTVLISRNTTLIKINIKYVILIKNKNIYFITQCFILLYTINSIQFIYFFLISQRLCKKIINLLIT